MAKSRKKQKKTKRAGKLLWIIATVLAVVLALWIVVHLTSDQKEAEDLPEEPGETVAEPEESDSAESAVPTEESTAEKPKLEGKEFPCELEDGKLLVDSLFQFTGFNPDNGGEPCDNAAAILLVNQSAEHLRSAVIRVVLPEGTTAEFHVADLPAGTGMMVMAADSIVSETSNLYKEISCEAEFDAEATLMADKLTVQTDGTAVTVVNYAEEELTNLVVYCHCLMEGNYFGGLTYSYPIETIAPGESVTIDAADCYFGEAAVVRIEQGS